jgi:hypothetical protein
MARARVNDLVKGQTYLFYAYRPSNKVNLFRANFVDIMGTTLVVSHYTDTTTGVVEDGTHTMPLEWIARIDTLDEKTWKKCPSAIRLQIDNWM